MKRWKIKFAPELEMQIIIAVEYFNNARNGYGSKFYKAVKK
jgi:hypothetical protein